MKLIDFYKAIFEFAGIETSDDHKLYTGKKLTDQRQPLLINGMHLVLPVPEYLRNSDPARMIVHPLAESLAKQIPPVIDRLSKILVRRFNLNIGEIGASIISALLNVKDHSHFVGDQLQMMEKLSAGIDWSAQDLSTWQSISSDSQKDKTSRWLVNLNVVRGGTYKGQKHHRVCVVWFPFYEYLCKLEKGEEATERKFTKGQVKKFKLLLEFILCGISEKEYYCHGTNSPLAPFMVALLMASSKIAMEINDLISTYGEPISKAALDISNCSFDMDWYDAMSELSSFEKESKLIPVQINNDGNFVIKEPSSQNESPPPVYQTQPQQVAYQQPPQVQSPPAPDLTGRTKATWGELVNSSQALQSTVMANRQYAYPQPQQAYPQQQIPSWAVPQQPQQQPVYYQQPGYPPQQAYPQQPPGYPPQQFIQQPPGYPPQQFVQPPPGYPQQGYVQPAYPQQPQQPVYYPQPGMRYPT